MIELTDIDSITITQNMTLSRLLSQLQKHSNQLLCLVDSHHVIYFNQKKNLPKNITFIDYKNFNTDIEYYFKDDTHDYTIFGTHEACVFYPDLTKILNLEKKEKIKIIEYVGKEKKIILYHLGNKLKFPFTNKNLIIIDKSI